MTTKFCKQHAACLVFVLLCSISAALAQPVKVLVAADRADWTYKTGENVNFMVSVFRYGNPVSDVEVQYEIGPEKMKPQLSKTIRLKDGQASVKGGSMKTPGFLRCTARVTTDGQEYSGYATAGFSPLEIQPATTEPEDFMAFWDKAKAEAAQVPMDARMTLLPERCTETVDVYHVSLQNYQPGTRLYGILAMPKKEGQYPAVLDVPGAGARPYGGNIALAEKGIISFQIGIHGVPVIMEPSVYDDMMRGPIAGYWNLNLDNKDLYYYKRVYLGCVRAIDFMVSLPGYDGERLAVQGGSQGGALSIVTAALDKRVKWLVPYYPALCDLTGYLRGRAGGWPHMFAEENKAFHAKEDKINTSWYYDVVNFARYVQVPGYYAWGFNDDVCPPTSMYAAYNVIKAPKQLLLAQDAAHWAYPEQYAVTDQWLLEQLFPANKSER